MCIRDRIMTAFAYCKPVIATNVGGLSEVVDEYSGILIEPRSVKQLVDSIYFSQYNLLIQ